MALVLPEIVDLPGLEARRRDLVPGGRDCEGLPVHLRIAGILVQPTEVEDWRDEQIVVVDDDQGESGASASWREGFQRLVSDVGLGRAGIVMGLEVSRLARNNADWHRLLEICALADTLMIPPVSMTDCCWA